MADPIEYCPDPEDVILAGPITDVLGVISAELDTLHSLSPSSDAIPALIRHRERLQAALERAGRRRIYVSPRVAARYLRVEVPAVTRLCRLGYIAAERIAGRWWISREALRQYGRPSR